MYHSGSNEYVLAKGVKPFREFMELCTPQPGIFMNWQLRSGNDLLMEYLNPSQKVGFRDNGQNGGHLSHGHSLLNCS